MLHKLLVYVLSPLLVCALGYHLFLSNLLFLKNDEGTTAPNRGDPPEHLLSEPCTFMGVGSQCIVFETKDDNLVLKVCKASRYQLPFFLRWSVADIIAPGYVSQKKEEKFSRKVRDFDSYELAATKLKSQTGITYLHISKDHLPNTLSLIDPLGIPHKIPASDLIFYVQKKASPLPDYIQELLQNGQVDTARNLFVQLFSMVLKNSAEGIYIKDTNPQKNIGVFNGKPMWIDPGRITFIASGEKKKVLRKFYKELATTFNDIEPVLQEALNEALSN